MQESEIFEKVIAESNLAKRAELIEEFCQNDAQLMARIRTLVAAHDHPKSFFDDPADVVQERDSDETFQLRTTLPQPGLQIGPYKLLQKIGEGGMGLVFMADQTSPVKRRVALKVIKPGMDSRQVIARFEAERQALALMDHPNIARVLDAGSTESGHPFFVMELVNGIPITQYCDQENLSPQQRLRMFISVCRAVQHAHQKGVIHRDLKPGNILVAEYDQQPVPKVIDFGVAKATATRLTEKTLFTEFGQLVGTLEYMSPEQSRRNQLDVDTRSDIYSLGIVLYKLLTGETPFGGDRFRQAAWDEMMKIIREEEPPRPSVKIGSSDALFEIARQRSVEPARLRSLVKGDLDWIVLKALEKDRNRRYSTAGDLAEDIDRHLSQRPIEARRHSTLELARKFVRRNRIAVAASVICVLAIVLVAAMFIRGLRDVANRTTRLVQATAAAKTALDVAVSAPIGDESPWGTASLQAASIRETLSDGTVHSDVREKAIAFLGEFDLKKSQRELAIKIEEIVIQSATHPNLASWQRMEKQMRAYFRENGFDLDVGDPASIGQQMRDDPSSAYWADLLELWIGAKAHMPALGGPKVTAADMQPWAEAIYVADPDAVRTSIRRFIYTPPWKKENIPELLKEVELSLLSPRTLSWLASLYNMVGEVEQCNSILETAIDLHPKDLMLAFDCGHVFFHQKRYQESARMFHRCIAIRSDVSGIWKSLSLALEKLGESEAAEKALQKSDQLSELE